MSEQVSTKAETLAEEIERYATTLEDIAERWHQADDAHTRQIARRLRVILEKHAHSAGSRTWAIRTTQGAGHAFDYALVPDDPNLSSAIGVIYDLYDAVRVVEALNHTPTPLPPTAAATGAGTES